MNRLLTTLADDATDVIDTRMLDQLPDQAWSYGPVFIFGFVLLLGFLSLIGFGIRRFDKHMSDALTMIRGHLAVSETTQNKILLSVVAIEIWMRTNTCRAQNVERTAEFAGPVIAVAPVQSA